MQTLVVPPVNYLRVPEVPEGAMEDAVSRESSLIPLSTGAAVKSPRCPFSRLPGSGWAQDVALATDFPPRGRLWKPRARQAWGEPPEGPGSKWVGENRGVAAGLQVYVPRTRRAGGAGGGRAGLTTEGGGQGAGA